MIPSKPGDEWENSEHAYDNLINDSSKDSAFLRTHGLYDTLTRIIGDASEHKLLDIGCGNGWLIDTIKPKEGYDCDIVRHHDLPNGRNYKDVDITQRLPYQEDFFDITVASLLLIWLDKIDQAISEIHRVTKHNGKVIISLMHPYFYRTGEVNKDDNVIIYSDLSKPFRIEDHKIGGVVGPFTYYYRPLNDYINEFINAGFRIKHLEDWFIDMDKYREHFIDNNTCAKRRRRTSKVPMYTFIECTKN